MQHIKAAGAIAADGWQALSQLHGNKLMGNVPAWRRRHSPSSSSPSPPPTILITTSLISSGPHSGPFSPNTCWSSHGQHIRPTIIGPKRDWFANGTRLKAKVETWDVNWRMIRQWFNLFSIYVNLFYENNKITIFNYFSDHWYLVLVFLHYFILFTFSMFTHTFLRKRIF